MGKVTMITGGHGSGKTAYSLVLAGNYKKKIYIATAEGSDDEMLIKIANHKAERDSSYQTVETPLNLWDSISANSRAELIVVDCLTVWVNNLLYYGYDVNDAFLKLNSAIESCDADMIFVTNECGFSLVPADKLSREYAKYLSKLNKNIANIADFVYLMVSGLPICVKGEK